VGFLRELLVYYVVSPFGSDMAFRRGFLTALAVAVAVYLAGYVLSRPLKKIAKFFKPTKEPATKYGPSSFKRLVDFVFAAIQVAVAAALEIIFIAPR